MGGDKTMATSSGTMLESQGKKAGSPAAIPSTVWNKECSHLDFDRAAGEGIVIESKIYKKSKVFAFELKRYFTLTANYLYYKKKKDGPIKGVLRLEDVQIEIMPNKKGFVLKRDTKKSKMLISDAETFNLWRKSFAKTCVFFNSFESNYEVNSHLGAGSFANVFLIERRDTRAVFAGKVFFKKGVAGNQKSKRELITSEINIMRRIDHKNFLKLEEVHETEDEIIIVSEFLGGGTLRKLISKTILSYEKRTRLISQLLEILEQLNLMEMTHRDLKPENLMFREDGSLVLIDFGLATEFSNKSRIQRQAGTAGYIAPEILSSSKQIFPEKIDLYSGGSIIFEIITGRQLFIGCNSKDVMLKNSKNCITNIQFYLINTDEREFQLVQSLLNTDPELRPAPAAAKSAFEKQL